MVMDILLLIWMVLMAAAIATWVLSLFVPCEFLERAISILTVLILAMMASVTVWSVVARCCGPAS